VDLQAQQMGWLLVSAVLVPVELVDLQIHHHLVVNFFLVHRVLIYNFEGILLLFARQRP